MTSIYRKMNVLLSLIYLLPLSQSLFFPSEPNIDPSAEPTEEPSIEPYITKVEQPQLELESRMYRPWPQSSSPRLSVINKAENFIHRAGGFVKKLVNVPLVYPKDLPDTRFWMRGPSRPVTTRRPTTTRKQSAGEATCKEELEWNAALNTAKHQEGDILILPRARTAVLDKAWTDCRVPYYIHPKDFKEENGQSIRDAMDAIQRASKVVFAARVPRDVNYLVITGRSEGCNAEVGSQGQGAQFLNLEAPNCLKKGTIIHELMHALGFVHEQNRGDRDKYVNIKWDNIEPSSKRSFEKKITGVTDFGESYDFKSVMHYEAFDYSTDSTSPAIEPKSSFPDITKESLGEGKRLGHLTKTDIAKLNKLYPNCPIGSDMSRTGERVWEC